MGKGTNSAPRPSLSIAKDEAYLQAIPRRNSIFKEIQARKNAERQSIAGDVIEVTLANGAVRSGKKWETTPLDIAKGVSESLASDALVSEVDGVPWDMSRPLEGHCNLKLFSFDSDVGRATFWHSSAHILGQALERTYGCKLCAGSCTTKVEGFYYDGFYGEPGLKVDHFDQIVTEAKRAVEEKQPFERLQVSRQEALDMFSDNKFKVEMIEELLEDTITVYRCGQFVDLCAGPHIPDTAFVKAIGCLKAEAANWKDNEDLESLQRVSGISYPVETLLKEKIAQLEEAEKYDHRGLGDKQQLFFFHRISPASCFFLPHGTRITDKLMAFVRKEYHKRGYLEVSTPNMFDMQLLKETSGHVANHEDNMFWNDQEVGPKPMNCPGHCMIFSNRVRSYKGQSSYLYSIESKLHFWSPEYSRFSANLVAKRSFHLPLRLADFGFLLRNEAGGAWSGLTRFQQDDAHIFCSSSQIKDEVKSVIDFISHVYDKFGFTFELRLSTRPDEFYGDAKTWVKVEAALVDVLRDSGKTWQRKEAEGAFYGPKIDVSVVSAAMKRGFQCPTLQLDFELPQRFNLSYSTQDENTRETPVMIHHNRAIFGSGEQMFAILLEHYKGNWPFWLSPRQAIVCPKSDKSQAYGQQVKDEINEAGYYVDIDTSDRTIEEKVKEARFAQYNYILVVGEEAEVKAGKVTVQVRDKQKLLVMTIPDLLQRFKQEVEAFHLISA